MTLRIIAILQVFVGCFLLLVWNTRKQRAVERRRRYVGRLEKALNSPLR